MKREKVNPKEIAEAWRRAAKAIEDFGKAVKSLNLDRPT